MGSPSFRRGAGEAKEAASHVFEAALLPTEEKEALCRGLLAEFGVTRISRVRNGEMIHSCPLPFGAHKNGDRNPSARLNFEKLVFTCSVCGSGGLLWFIGVCRGVDTDEARRWLESQTGTGGVVQDLDSILKYLDAVYSPKRTTLPPIPKMNATILEPWMLIHPWLTEIRGIPEQNIVNLKVGWNPDTDRIVIPHFWKGDLVGWQTRRLRKDDGTPKYLSSPDLPKEQTIYNYDARRQVAVVVESPMSVLAKTHRWPIMEATFGAEVTARQVRLLAEHRRVILFFDNDKAGWKATHTVAEGLEGYSSVWVVENPWAADPADMDDDTVARLIADAVPYSVWNQPKSSDLLEWPVKEAVS